MIASWGSACAARAMAGAVFFAVGSTMSRAPCAAPACSSISPQCALPATIVGGAKRAGSEARSEAEARGIVTSQMYRQLSLAVHGGHMRVIHARCGYVGLSHDAAVTEAVRQAAPEAAQAAAWPGPRPLGVGRTGSGG